MTQYAGDVVTDLINRWDEFGIEYPRPKKSSYMQIIGTTGTHGKATFLIWVDGGQKPCLVLKLLRNPQDSSDLENEYLTLMSLKEISDLVGTFPFPLYFGRIGQSLGLLETAMPGVSLAKLLQEKDRNALNVTVSAVEWLINLQKKTSHLSILTDPDMDGILKDPYKELMANSDLSEAEKLYFQNYYEIASDKMSRSISRSTRHGDFWGGNILVDNRSIRIIDWEFSRKQWWPLYDLFYFCFQLVITMDGVPIVDAMQKAFDIRFHRAPMIKQFLINYCDGLHIDRSDVGMFFWSFIFTLANRERTSSIANAQQGFLNLSNYPSYNKKTLNVFLRRGIYLDTIRSILSMEKYLLWNEWLK